MRHILTVTLTLGLLTGCATTAGKTAVTAEERAECQAMADQMGTNQAHSHAEMKGQPNVVTTMNREHTRCRAILAEPR